MIPLFNATFRRRLAWLALLLAAGSYVALAIAEQGSAPVGFSAPPSQPLPFERQRVFGLNLTDRSSVDALNWLNAAGNPSLALIAVAIDPDVVGALSVADQQPLAYSALDLLFGSTADSPLAVCLHEPPGTVGQLGVAQAAVGTLNERYTARIAYVAGCPSDAVEWRRAVARAAMKAESPVEGFDSAYVPLSSGAALSIQDVGNDTLQRAALRSGGTSRYTLLDAPPRADISANFLEQARAALRDYAQIGLVLARPAPGVDPGSFAREVGAALLPTDPAPQGFSPVNAGAVRLSGDWPESLVGAVAYRRAANEGAALTVDFVGEDVYLLGLVSPGGGTVTVWLDPPDGPLPPPSGEISLDAAQARDAAVPLFTGLPATQHRVVLASAGGDVVVSGIFISGRATPGWANGVAAFGLLVVSIAALAQICFAAVQNIRAEASVGSRRRGGEHPRGFSIRR
jgi:hypothetical protein